MIYNIIFLLKLRKYIFNLYQENRLYKFSIDSNPYICDIEGTFDTESKLVFAYLKKYCIPKHIYILQNICNFNCFNCRKTDCLKNVQSCNYTTPTQ